LQENPDAVMIGRNILHYQLLAKIGSGAMGEVYKAQDSRLNRLVAIKLLRPSAARGPERRRRFFQEAQAASALNHPGIVTIHDVFSGGDGEGIVMEYIAGKTLADLIPAGGLPAPLVLRYGAAIASALGAAHAAGIIHRDLKPGNIMVSDSGFVKLLDFGLAKLIETGPVSQLDETVQTRGPALTLEGSIVGTVSYMSPEQAESKTVDARSDIFSFGAVLYEMVTGRRAFEGESQLSTLTAVLRDESRPVAELAPDVPAPLAQIIYRCLRKNPGARYQSISQVETELNLVLQPGASGPPGRPALPADKRSWSVAGLLQLAGLVLILAGAGRWWWVARHNVTPPPAPTPAAVATPVAPAPVDTAITNDSIIEMMQAKAPVPVIVDQIRSSKTNFNLSTAEVIRLVKAGVPQAVIEVMRDPKRVVSSEPATPAPAPAAEAAKPAPTPLPPPVPSANPAVSVTLSDALPFRITLDEDIPADAEAGLPLHFTAAADLRVNGAVVIATGAAVAGEIAEVAKKKFLLKGARMTFRLLKADAVDNQKLTVRSTPSGSPKRPVDAGKGARSKDVAAAKGAGFIGYIDGEQTVLVRR
jgi:tRNA A-37 threonylcarbamoyl transferase component Bud32